MTTQDPVRVLSLDVENVKRVQAVSIYPAATGLTVLGGDNRQGKSSILDAIMAALGGEKYTPTDAVHAGATKGAVTVRLSNGLVVTKTFTAKGAYLKVDDPSGKKGGQALVNELVSELALNLGKFTQANDETKAKTLLKIIGIDLAPFDERRRVLEAERLAVGRQRDKAKGHAESMPYNDAVGNTPQTPSEIMSELQDKLAHNAEQVRRRNNRDKIASELKRLQDIIAEAQTKVAILQNDLAIIAEPEPLADTKALQNRLAQIEDTNAEIRKNLEREKALAEAENYAEEYRALSKQIEDNEAERRAQLDGAIMPLEGLTVEAGALVYNGHAWDCMSGADQLRVATAIVRKLNPRCGFVLIDKIEQMDLATLREFGAWLETEGLQAITTRVSTGPECSVIIEDGRVAGKDEDTEEPSFA